MNHEQFVYWLNGVLSGKETLDAEYTKKVKKKINKLMHSRIITLSSGQEIYQGNDYGDEDESRGSVGFKQNENI